MEVFRVRDRLIEDYRDFTGSFVDIHDKSIGDHVRERTARGHQWQDPWLSLNMTQPALSRLEAGGVVPTIPLLERISAALEADLIVAIALHAA